MTDEQSFSIHLSEIKEPELVKPMIMLFLKGIRRYCKLTSVETRVKRFQFDEDEKNEDKRKQKQIYEYY